VDGEGFIASRKTFFRRFIMSNVPQVFSNQEFDDFRAVEADGKPCAVGVDVARGMDYSNPSKAVIDHCKGLTKLIERGGTA
jgi:prophage antirepressor-like protein